MLNTFPAQRKRFAGMKPDIEVKNTIQPVDREDANVEAEAGETLVTDLDFDGLPEQYMIGGESHANGGTPLNVPADSFIFSKDKSLKIKDPEIQKDFGKSVKESGYTPADLAKQYDINKYQKILADPRADDIQRSTAEAMIAKYNEKLGKLALVQESLKGFEEGIPAIAMPYLISTGFDPTTIMGTQATEETPDADQARYGGTRKRKVQIVELPKAQDGNKGKQIDPAKRTGIYAHTPTEVALMKFLSPETVLSEEEVPGIQPENKAGTYGQFNPDKANKNWDWYGKPINWKDKAAVKQAGKDFNETLFKKIKAAGYSDKFAQKTVESYGFVDKAGLPNSLDVASGKYHETRVMPKNIAPATPESIAQAEASVREPDLDPIKTNKLLMKKKEAEDPKFWIQDQINMAGAFRDLNSAKKYMPYIAPVNLTTPEATYFDPSRELANVSEQANIASLAAAMYAGPQGLSARLSAIAGQATGDAANILGKYNTMNVDVANKQAALEAETANRQAEIDAGRATELAKQTNIVNQQFDNTKMALRANMRTALNAAITNRGQTQALNAMNEQYQVDPTTGFVNFTKARPWDPSSLKGTGTSEKDVETKVSELLKIPGMTAEVAHKIAMGK